MQRLHSKMRILLVRNLQVRTPAYSRGHPIRPSFRLLFQVLEFRRIVIAPSLVAHHLLLEDPEIRRCGFQTLPVRAGRFQMSQWGLAGFHRTRETANATR
jgi:hypothetical protein